MGTFFGNTAQVSTNRLDGAAQNTGGSYTGTAQTTSSGALDKIKAIANNALHSDQKDTGNAMNQPDALDVGDGLNQPEEQDVGNGLTDLPEQQIGSPYPTEAEEMILDFEGIAPSQGTAYIPDGYGGGDWNNVGVLDAGYLIQTYDTSGYMNVIQSGTASTYNGFGAPIAFTVTNLDTFSLASGFFAAAWNNDLTVVVEAIRDDVVVGTAALLLSPQPAEINFLNASSDANADAQFIGDFNNLDGFTMTSSGGTNAGLDGGGEHFTMDDLVFLTGVVVVDEVGTPFWNVDQV